MGGPATVPMAAFLDGGGFGRPRELLHVLGWRMVGSGAPLATKARPSRLASVIMILMWTTGPLGALATAHSALRYLALVEAEALRIMTPFRAGNPGSA